jgi:hypothetical protein
VSASKRVDSTVWQLDPAELSRRNRQRLAAYDCPDEEVRGFIARGKFSPTLETAFVDAYVALAPAEGCADLLLLASYARNEIEARYLVNLLSLLVAERRGEPGGRIVLIGTGVALDIGTKRRPELLLPLPVDRFGWNEGHRALLRGLRVRDHRQDRPGRRRHYPARGARVGAKRLERDRARALRGRAGVRVAIAAASPRAAVRCCRPDIREDGRRPLPDRFRRPSLRDVRPTIAVLFHPLAPRR